MGKFVKKNAELNFFQRIYRLYGFILPISFIIVVLVTAKTTVDYMSLKNEVTEKKKILATYKKDIIQGKNDIALLSKYNNILSAFNDYKASLINYDLLFKTMEGYIPKKMERGSLVVKYKDGILSLNVGGKIKGYDSYLSLLTLIDKCSFMSEEAKQSFTAINKISFAGKDDSGETMMGDEKNIKLNFTFDVKNKNKVLQLNYYREREKELLTNGQLFYLYNIIRGNVNDVYIENNDYLGKAFSIIEEKNDFTKTAGEILDLDENALYKAGTAQHFVGKFEKEIEVSKFLIKYLSKFKGILQDYSKTFEGQKDLYVNARDSSHKLVKYGLLAGMNGSGGGEGEKELQTKILKLRDEINSAEDKTNGLFSSLFSDDKELTKITELKDELNKVTAKLNELKKNNKPKLDKDGNKIEKDYLQELIDKKILKINKQIYKLELIIKYNKYLLTKNRYNTDNYFNTFDKLKGNKGIVRKDIKEADGTTRKETIEEAIARTEVEKTEKDDNGNELEYIVTYDQLSIDDVIELTKMFSVNDPKLKLYFYDEIKTLHNEDAENVLKNYVPEFTKFLKDIDKQKETMLNIEKTYKDNFYKDYYEYNLMDLFSKVLMDFKKNNFNSKFISDIKIPGYNFSLENASVKTSYKKRLFLTFENDPSTSKQIEVFANSDRFIKEMTKVESFRNEINDLILFNNGQFDCRKLDVKKETRDIYNTILDEKAEKADEKKSIEKSNLLLDTMIIDINMK